MNTIDIANYISDQCTRSLKTAIQFIENELSIAIAVVEGHNEHFTSYYQITYNGNKLDKQFYYDQAREFVLELWKHLDKKQRQILINVCKTSIENVSKLDSKANSENNISIMNVANANASNENTINISTLSELSSYVNNDNKQLIKNIEESMMDNDTETYFSLILQLFEKLADDKIIPPLVYNSLKFLKNKIPPK